VQLAVQLAADRGMQPVVHMCSPAPQPHTPLVHVPSQTLPQSPQLLSSLPVTSMQRVPHSFCPAGHVHMLPLHVVPVGHG
jgi:hypothetical protein